MESVLLRASKSAGVSASSSPSRMPVQYRTSKARNEIGLSMTWRRSCRYSSRVQNFISTELFFEPIFPVRRIGLAWSP